MRNKQRNRLDMNKTEETPYDLKLTNFQPALKKLTDKKPGARFAAVGTRVAESKGKCSTATPSFQNFPTRCKRKRSLT